MIFIYGLAVMVNTGSPIANMDENEIAAFLQETGSMLLAGLRAVP